MTPRDLLQQAELAMTTRSAMVLPAEIVRNLVRVALAAEAECETGCEVCGLNSRRPVACAKCFDAAGREDYDYGCEQ